MNPAVVFDGNDPDVQLVPFALMRDDHELRVKYLGWLNDLDVVRLIASPALMSLDKDMSFIDDSFVRFTQPGCRAFFVYYEPDEVFIGTAKLDGISTYTRSAWDGIMIGDQRYRGLGLSIKVYRVLLAYGFLELGLNRVSGGCNERNVPMVQTFNRLGYTLEGRLRQADCIDGELSDHLYFGILREEFLFTNKLDLKITARREP